MQTLIEQLKQLSAELLPRLSEAGVEEFAAYMEEREAIFSLLMQGTLAPELQEDAKLILAMDKQITARMEQLKQEASMELNRIQQGRRARNTYDSDNGYQEESFFFDRRR